MFRSCLNYSGNKKICKLNNQINNLWKFINRKEITKKSVGIKYIFLESYRKVEIRK